jgi:DNA replication protein DnaC
VKRCQAETYCKGYPNKCHDLCIGYVQLQIIYKLSRMPLKYQYPIKLEATENDDLDSFYLLNDFKNNVMEHVRKGDSLFIFSRNKGNGKTSWACKIMNEYFKHVALNNNQSCRGLFINVPEFFDTLRRDMDNPSEEVEELIRNIRKADIVIWDDIGTETPTKWVREKLYTYINYRESNLKTQIFTSNIPPDILKQEEYLGERIVSRILGQCAVIEFVAEDKRGVNNWSNFK